MGMTGIITHNTADIAATEQLVVAITDAQEKWYAPFNDICSTSGSQ
jgi:hypothetical protein